MINRQLRMTKLKAVLLLAVVAAVFLALQFGPAAAQKSTTKYLPADQDRYYTCTPGPTGHCEVYYYDYETATHQEAMDLCGSEACVARIEYRW